MYVLVPTESELQAKTVWPTMMKNVPLATLDITCLAIFVSKTLVLVTLDPLLLALTAKPMALKFVLYAIQVILCKTT